MLPGRMAHQRVAGDVESHVIGQTDGKRSSGTGTTPQVEQCTIGMGQPSSAGAKRPSAQAVHCFARALGDLLHPAGDLAWHLRW